MSDMQKGVRVMPAGSAGSPRQPQVPASQVLPRAHYSDTRARPRSQRGFTLLEVMVALTIAAMALGGIFSVIGGNKQLAWRSQEALLHTMRARALIGFSQLDDTRGDLIVDFTQNEMDVADAGELPIPLRQTQPMRFSLHEYEILDENGEPIAVGSYWIESDLPQ